MVSRCANPSCDARFKYLREGRLFHFRPSPSATPLGAVSGLWWLCARCCTSITLVPDGNGAVKVVPFRESEGKVPGRALRPTGSD